MYYKCTYCGARLDPQEACNCEEGQTLRDDDKMTFKPIYLRRTAEGRYTVRKLGYPVLVASTIKVALLAVRFLDMARKTEAKDNAKRSLNHEAVR